MSMHAPVEDLSVCNSAPSDGQGRRAFFAPTRRPMSPVGELPTSSLDSASSPLPSDASTSAANPHRRGANATFAWAKVPNMTACAPATVSWIYSGPEQELLVSIYPGHNPLSISVNATAQTHTILAVQLTPGEYTITASGPQDLEYGSHQTRFLVNGTNTSCLPPAKRSHGITTRTTTTDVTSTNNGALVAGIAVGVGGAVTLLAVGFYFRFAVMRLFRRCDRHSKAREADPQVPGYEGPWNPLHSRNISDVDLESEFKPISQPVPIAVAPILKTPKPPRRSTLRQSGTSAFTSASTALSDMPLLKSGPHGPVQVELQRAFALATLDAIMDHPPLPTATPPPPSRTPSPSPSSLMTVTPAPQMSQTSRRSPTSPTPRSPLSPAFYRMSTQQPLSRTGSGRSRIVTRKPVPPIDPSATPAPSDVASSIIWTRRSSYASTYAWNGRGSPVPSSSTSQMYRTRDSAWSGSLTGSEWTWTRPVEEWEREQMRALAAVNAEIATDAETGRSGRASPSGVGNGTSGLGARGGAMRRNQSFGDMKAMKAVIPDLPPVPDCNVTQ
ncbi:hypothetical protein C8T65DRAFT_763728 [Cerioporus squamosus]|nr:hypothetical protein C8T65DRAFT_763728 [Cerioporus squamosus]